MRLIQPAALVFALVAIAAAPSPQAEWKAGIADQNKAYAQKPHAMLKIQGASYLGDGDVAVLVGRPGDPGSWHWSGDAKARGVLRVSLKGGHIAVMRNGKPVDAALITKSIPVDRHVDIAGQPTQVGAGVDGWRIFIYNQQAPAAKSFKGVSYYPYDPAWRLDAAFKPDPKLPPRVFRTSRGTGKQFFHAGDAVFTVKGRAVTLPFYTDSHDPKQVKELSAFFTDGLSGKGAYITGRYVDTEDFGAFPPSHVTIDFNDAYNPNCARSAHFTCPLAVDAIPLPVAAGERDPHLQH